MAERVGPWRCPDCMGTDDFPASHGMRCSAITRRFLPADSSDGARGPVPTVEIGKERFETIVSATRGICSSGRSILSLLESFVVEDDFFRMRIQELRDQITVASEAIEEGKPYDRDRAVALDAARRALLRAAAVAKCSYGFENCGCNECLAAEAIRALAREPERVLEEGE